MDRRSEKLYLVELVCQCEFAVYAFAAFQSANQVFDLDEVMRHAHSFLTHVSCASRILWPPPVTAKHPKPEQTQRSERGVALRALLKLPDEHPLTRRKLRDHLEHFDERLDAWVAQGAERRLIRQGLNSVSSSSPDTARTTMRDYNQQEGFFSYFGERFDMREMYNEARTIGEAAYSILVERFLEEGGDPENVHPFACGLPEIDRNGEPCSQF